MRFMKTTAPLVSSAMIITALIAGVGDGRVDAQQSRPSSGARIDVLSKTARSGVRYQLYFNNNCSAAFSNFRPNARDGKLFFCIPAAFTASDNNIDGVFICNGKVGNSDRVNPRIGGAMIIQDGACRIFPTNGGKLLTPEFVNHSAARKDSLFQQFQVVIQGHGEKFSDKTVCQRRGIATFADGKLAILESIDPLSLTDFGLDAAGFGVQDLLYTDMGPWSEGWYRNAEGKIIVIGQSRSLTHKQTNWFYLRSKS
ncbi:MAG: hypothetical protein K2W95_30355 [Candidatus Obscuribacterales bacterium]|nr:hypothetical protein [Candidatus Obscuribacterales bacterium]